MIAIIRLFVSGGLYADFVSILRKIICLNWGLKMILFVFLKIEIVHPTNLEILIYAKHITHIHHLSPARG